MPRFNHAPIERHEALAPFSRDHYGGLVQAQHLVKAADADPSARRKTLAEFVDVWDHEIAGHFDDEERLLLELMVEADRRRLLDEHAELRAMADEARAMRRQTDPDPDKLRELGRTLNAHIRWEERELFGRLQGALSDEQLTLLQQHTAPIEAARPRDTCRSAHADDDNQSPPSDGTES